MQLTVPSGSVVALAAFLRDRLAGVSDTVANTLADAVSETVTRTVRYGRDGAAVVTTLRPDDRRVDVALLAAARQFATTVVGATAPFAGSSYARMRLIRQMHASGLLTAEQARRIDTVLHESEIPELDLEPVGAPRRPRPGTARSC